MGWSPFSSMEGMEKEDMAAWGVGGGELSRKKRGKPGARLIVTPDSP